MVTTKPTTGRRARGTARRKYIRRVVTSAVVLVAFLAISIALRLCGCMRLDAAASRQAAIENATARLERGNLHLQARLNALAHPDRLSRIAEDSGMMPLEPSALVWCPSPARMAKATGTPSSGDLRSSGEPR